MHITREQIREDVLEYFALHKISIVIREEDQMFKFKLNDFDLIDMELDLEEKYGINHEEDEEGDIVGLSESDTLLEVINKLFEYFKNL
jgi:hypothetical protein